MIKTGAFVIHLDDYHLGDPLFVQNLARALHRRKPHQCPCLIVHGSGEQAERALEGRGWFVDRLDGILQLENAAQAALVAQTIRQTNHKLVSLFTEAVVSAVGIPAGDRRLLAVDGEGAVHTGPTQWVEQLMLQDVVPLVAAYANMDGGVRSGEVRTGAVTSALCNALPATAVFLTRTGLPGIMRGRKILPGARVDELNTELVSGVGDVERCVEERIPVLLTNPSRLISGEVPLGTAIVE